MSELERASQLIFSNHCLFHFTDEGAKVQRKKETHSTWHSWVYPVSPPWPGTFPGKVCVPMSPPARMEGHFSLSTAHVPASHLFYYPLPGVVIVAHPMTARLTTGWPPGWPQADLQDDHRMTAGWPQAGRCSQQALPRIMASVSLLRMSPQTLEKARLDICPVNLFVFLGTLDS